MLSKKFTAVAGASEPTDAQFNYVTALLHGDGTNGAKNNSFVDSSSNAFSITTNGQVTQGSFSPYGTFGAKFSDRCYAYMPASADYDITNGDWTIEFWIYINVINTMGSSGTSIATNFTGGVGWSVAFGNYGADMTDLSFACYSGGWTAATNSAINSNSMPYRKWHHIAIVRSGSGSGNLKFYLNGVATGGTFNAPTYSGAANELYYGIYAQNYSYSGNPNFNISDFRLVKGTAVYTADFTPPTTKLTAITNTKILAFQDNRFVNSVTGSAMTVVTVNGSPSIQRFRGVSSTEAYSKSIIGGSAYFFYGYPHLYTSNNSAFDFGTGDFTVEFWCYVTPAVANNARFISNAAYNGSGIDISWEAGQSRLTWYIGGTAYATAVLPTLNSWNHVAFSRSGTTLRVYLNGALSNTYTGMSANISSGGTLRIGEYGPTGYPLDSGYMSDVRLVKGTALYTGSSLTVPTAPLTAVSGTSLLLNMTNAAIVDETMANNFETGGNVQISTSVKKYGTGSIYFDGSGDYLMSANPVLVLGPSSDFTIEMWVYPTTTGSYRSLVTWQNGYSSNSNYSYVVAINSSNVVQNQVDDGNTQYFSTTSATVTANAWNHIAFVKNGNSVKTYLNGVGATAANPNTFNALYDGRLYVGIDMNGSSAFTGYIDDLRITKGYARYTSDFTPPTEAYPNK